MVRARLGLLGSGTVGEAIQDIVFERWEEVRARAGVELKIVKIYTPHPENKKWYRRYPDLFTASADDVTRNPEVDIVVEVLGTQDPSDLPRYRDYIVRALENGKDVVTSDKAVLARFGAAIADAVAHSRRELRFEACVGGGIPIIRALAEGFAAEEPAAIFGIINGTCNFILSGMAQANLSFGAALAEAQRLGYAETDPSADTSGSDAEAKLVILAAVGFGAYAEPGAILRKGIEEIQPIDFLYAGRKAGATIKHLAMARRDNDRIEAMVAPFVVPLDHLAARIDGATNAIFFGGRRSAGPAATLADARGGNWNYAFIGPGSGGGPTAVAVLGDVCDLARGRRHPLPQPLARGRAAGLKFRPQDEIAAPFYLRFVVRDRPGIVGEICQVLGAERINVAEIWQLAHSADEIRQLAESYGVAADPAWMLPFVITLEQTTVGKVKRALGAISARDFNLAPPLWLPIWKSP
ncbi:MAG TPA: homoserine dehydrogenase [Candidatus Acidoferrales bacterium]|nr:homoserine dehydrogenase [Candidatus Acidoferrales bacterium]